jgi:hypothetical protein
MFRRDCPSLTRIVSWCDSVCIVIFPVGDDPFDILLRVNGSGDLVFKYPDERISAYSESDSISDIVYYFKLLDFPSSDLLAEADWLEREECRIDTGGAVALSSRENPETTDRGFDCHRELDCGKRHFLTTRRICLPDLATSLWEIISIRSPSYGYELSSALARLMGLIVPVLSQIVAELDCFLKCCSDPFAGNFL